MATQDTASFEISSFDTDVLQASHKQPVLVDFWAPWCGPCRTLGPVLERLAQDPDAPWSLAKVNTDEHSQLAQQYNVRGIPAVKLFVDGEVAAEFTGALPEHQIRTWLAEHVPSEDKKALTEAKELLDKGQRSEARDLLETIVAEEAETDEAETLLAGLVVFTDPDRAETLLEGTDVADPDLLQTKEAVRTIARLLRLYQTPDDIPDGEVQLTYVQAIEALTQQDFDAALERFIDVVRQDRSYDDDGARKACVALFSLLGREHSLTKKHRPAFDTSLY